MSEYLRPDHVRRIDIAIASPGDVVLEREAIRRLFTRWNHANDHAILHPVMWEFASPELGDHPQHLLNQQIIDRSELLIAVFWAKLGTPTPTAQSGTVAEIREFVAKKGPRRVMLYFCIRDIPHSTNPAELARLHDFKNEMRSKGLYHEYRDVGDLERDLYSHLDVKVHELMTGQLPIPESPERQVATPDPRPDLIDFGMTLPEIVSGFARRMDQFDAIQGAGPEKYLALAAHVYRSAAHSLDRFLAFSAAGITLENRAVLESFSAKLKRLAAKHSEYTSKPFPQFFNEGRIISDDLSAHVVHLGHLKRR